MEAYGPGLPRPRSHRSRGRLVATIVVAGFAIAAVLVTARSSPACSPPGPGSARPAGLSGPALSITGFPALAPIGYPVVIRGRVRRPPVVHQTVSIWQLTGRSTCTRLATATTSATGNYAYTLPPGQLISDRIWFATTDRLRSSVYRQTVVRR
jgi:hypothetical protein